MGLKLNTIIVLENKEQFLIFKEAMYYGKKYFLGMGLNDKKEVDPKKVTILEEYVSAVDTFVSKVYDSNLITVLTRMFKAQVEIL